MGKQNFRFVVSDFFSRFLYVSDVKKKHSNTYSVRETILVLRNSTIFFIFLYRSKKKKTLEHTTVRISETYLYIGERKPTQQRT